MLFHEAPEVTPFDGIISTHGLQVLIILTTLEIYVDNVTIRSEDMMAIPIKPLADRVIAIREQTQSKTASGLYLPDNAKEKSVVAIVQAVGPDVKSLKKGDRIVYKEYSVTELKVATVEYLVVKEEDVLAILA